MTAKELIKELLEFPYLDTPVVIRGNELHTYEYDVGKVDHDIDDDEIGGYKIILFEGPLSIDRRRFEAQADRDLHS